MSGRPSKRLSQHVYDRTFIPSRHEHLLADDDWLEKVTLSDAQAKSDDGQMLLALYELALYYRHVATSDRERRRASLAFRDVVHGDFDRYCELFTSPSEGKVRGFTWPEGRDAPPVLEERPSELLRELWEGLAKLAAQRKSARSQAAFARKIARKYQVEPQLVAEHVLRALEALDREEASV